jgi:hypothetical protein
LTRRSCPASSAGPEAILYLNVVVATPGSSRGGYVCNGGTSVQNIAIGFEMPYSGCSR